MSHQKVPMHHTDSLVSVGLPVRDGANRVESAIRSVLGQDHENLELVICDNASADNTEELCRDLAARDNRIVYHRHPVNVGMLNNFMSTMRLATGTFFRWMGDDDWLAPNYVSRLLEVFAADSRLILVTSQLEYVGSDGLTETAAYDGTGLDSDNPVTRLSELLRLLNESHLLLDEMYGLMRRKDVVNIPRRNMMHEDQVFATKLALAGPWGHVPEVLGRRGWDCGSLSDLARKLDVPTWQAHVANTLQCREILGWLQKCDLDEGQRNKARIAVARMYMRRQQIVATRRTRKAVRLAQEFATSRRSVTW